MKKLTAVLISVVLTMAIVAIYIVPSLIFEVSKSHVKESLNLSSYVVMEENGKKVVFKKPLAWSEVFELFLSGRASYKLVLPLYSRDDLLLIYFTYMRNTNAQNPCKAVEDMYRKRVDYDVYKPLFENDCYLLKKLFFGVEREWYPTLALIPVVAEKLAKRYSEYSIWAIAYFENGSMIVEFYNLVDPNDEKAFLNKYNQLIKAHPRVVVLLDKEFHTIWYSDYELLEKTGMPYILVFEVASNKAIKPPLARYLEAYGLDYYELQGMIYENGKLRAVYVESDVFCEKVNMLCSDSLKNLLETG